MGIAADDLEFRLSGGSSNTNPDASLGGGMSADDDGVIASDVLGNLWDNVTGEEAAAGMVSYRACYVKNARGTDPWQAVRCWINLPTASPSTEFDIGLAVEGVGVEIVETLADELHPPTGVEFSRPAAREDGLVVGDIPPGGFCGIWIRLTVQAGAGAFNNSGSIRCEGSSG